MLLADIAIINKVDAAAPESIEKVRKNIQICNPRADIVLATSPALVRAPERIAGKTVLVVEDGPTLTRPRLWIPGLLRWVPYRKFLPAIPISGGSCRPWATARRRSGTWPPPSKTPPPIWSSFPPPFTCAACSPATNPPSGCAMSIRIMEDRHWKRCLTKGWPLLHGFLPNHKVFQNCR
jgi:hypothetical protein